MNTFLGAIKGKSTISEKDFLSKKKFVIGNVIVKLEKRRNPNYYIAKYIDKSDMEIIGIYGSPNMQDVIFDISSIINR